MALANSYDRATKSSSAVVVVVVAVGRVKERMEERSTEEARRIARSQRVSSSARGATTESFFLLLDGFVGVWDRDNMDVLWFWPMVLAKGRQTQTNTLKASFSFFPPLESESGAFFLLIMPSDI